jgi:hypothetical protein
MSSERYMKNYLTTSKMNKKKKIRLITEYLLNKDAGDKNEMRGFLIENEIKEEELEELERLTDQLYELPDREPSEKMKAAFYSKLEEYKSSLTQNEPRVYKLDTLAGGPRYPSLIRKLAYAAVLLVLAGLAAFWYRSELKYKNQVASMISQMQDMQKMMMLTLLEQPSPTDRLKAINISNQINNADDKIIDALLNTLNNDENVNVRLMAVEALYNYAENPKVRIGLIRSIVKQESPIVQVALADVMVMLQEKRSVSELKKLLEKNNIDKNVETKLKNSIKQLI